MQAGDIELVDVLVVSAGEGAPGVVSAYAVNVGEEPLTLDLLVESDAGRTALSPTVEVGTNEGVRLDGMSAPAPVSGSEEPVLVEAVNVLPGEVLMLRMTTSAGETTSARVPVLPPEGPYGLYADLLSG